MLEKKYAQQISACHNSGHLEQFAHMYHFVHSQLIELLKGRRQVLDFAATMWTNELRLQQIVQSHILVDKGVIFPRQQHQLIIEEFRIDEGVELNREPVDGHVHNAVAKVVFKINGPGDRIKSQHDTRSN